MSGSAHTVGRWLTDSAAIAPDRVAIDFLDEQITYRTLCDRTAHRLGELVDAELSPGDRVATLTRNSPAHVELFFACALGRFIMVPLNWRLTVPELAWQISDVDPAMVLAEEGLLPAAREAVDLAGTRSIVDVLRPAPSIATSRGDKGSSVRTDQVARTLHRSAASPDLAVAQRLGPEHVARDEDPLLIIYTSGTTGRPKGAVLTHANCFWTNLSLDRCAEVRGDDVVLQVLPQCHVAGWNVQPLLAWWKGATVVLEAEFDPGRVLERIATKGITTLMGVPTNYLLLAQHPAFPTTDLHSLRHVVVGGAPMPLALLDTWASRGVTVLQGYGLTEAAPNVLCVPAAYARQKQGSAGRPYPYVDVALRSLEDDCALDEAGSTASLVEGPGSGELLVSGGNVFAGYWRDPTSTAATVRGGWLATGDIAERDADGFYWIRGRLKEMFISGGENVYPAEVEGVIAACDGVADAAVVGVPDARWGETGCAFVVPEPGSNPSVEELVDHCRQRLARYKVPRHVHFVEAIPRLANGKVDKVRLSSEARKLVMGHERAPDVTGGTA
jgi:fatty-acyl-CoA synthase